MKVMNTDNKLFTKILSRDDFPKRHLQDKGKDILHIVKPEQLSRSVLLDDQTRYLKPHPKNGILVPIFKEISTPDKWMLKCFLHLCWLHMIGDVRHRL
eukprot:UN08006